eukprot:gnl/Hemi2/27651_TR9140_c0_g1_i1.p1 gnl/Hemi2/27651_TR9140_c0_g1~~gnl/Hemi2/27651_TR9140_c0_g1_i1.p1  ORF type:complete len:420 (+),score=11.52 gnl/Hemi2/27651_TR9140_c0_g1_i1:62-1321(+)
MAFRDLSNAVKAVRSNAAVTVDLGLHRSAVVDDVEALVNAAISDPPLISSLNRVSLSGNHVTDEGVVTLCEFLRHNQTVLSLSIYSDNITLLAVKAVALLLQENSTVSVLRLGGKRLNDLCVSLIATILKLNTTLRFLELSGIQIGDQAVTSIKELVNCNDKIERIEINEHCMSDAALRRLNEAVARKHGLSFRVAAGDQGIRALCAVMGKNNTLKNLDISHNCVTSLGAKSIGSILKRPGRSTSPVTGGYHNGLLLGGAGITHINLSHNRISDDGVSVIAEALAANKNLIRLDLSHNEIGNQGAKMLVEALAVNTCLEELDISQNNIDPLLQHYIRDLLRHEARKQRANKLLRNLPKDNMTFALGTTATGGVETSPVQLNSTAPANLGVGYRSCLVSPPSQPYIDATNPASKRMNILV